MSELVRIALVLGAVLLVIVAVRLVGRWQRPSHPPINAAAIPSGPGVVVFTSTDCANCRAALGVVETLGVGIREVTWELEPGVFEAAGVEAVPLTVVVGDEARVELLATGVPRKSALRRAAARAGLL